jgi:hypothetical protein
LRACWAAAVRWPRLRLAGPRRMHPVPGSIAQLPGIDAVLAASHVRDTLDEDGTCLLVEPFAEDRLEDNLTPVGRISYAASTMLCTPGARAQEGGVALGAQAGEARLRDVLTQAGFSRVRRAAETPFNLVLEARR